MKSKKNNFVVLSVLSCLAFNYFVLTESSSVLAIIGMILFFFSLYKISVLSGESGWYAGFGVLNVFGLIIVLIATRQGNSSQADVTSKE
jgi:uncharacterized membrane protein